jgi:putative oxidoreductase
MASTGRNLAVLPGAGMLAARVALSAVFLYSGFTKLFDWPAGVAEVTNMGLPMPALALTATVSVQIVCGLMVLMGVAARWGALLLAGFTIAATLIAHDFWAHEGLARQQQLTIFLEHAAIAGGFLPVMLHGPGPLSLDGLIAVRRRGLL